LIQKASPVINIDDSDINVDATADISAEITNTSTPQKVKAKKSKKRVFEEVRNKIEEDEIKR
jgi:hypothetical protein